jgi:hypothetical protein
MQTVLARTLFSRHEDHGPDAAYLTQNLGLQQTVVGRVAIAWEIAVEIEARMPPGERDPPRLSSRSAMPMQRIVNDDWTAVVAAATVLIVRKRIIY